MSKNLSLVPVDQGLSDAAIEIAARRADTEREMKAALEAGDDQKALSLLRKHLGVDAKTRNRATSSVNGRTGRRGSRLVAVAANDQP